MYDSKSEAKYAEMLDSLKNNGLIKDIRRQIRYPLIDKDGKKRLAYIADFVVTSNTDKEYVIDVKGILTPACNIKLAFFSHVYEKHVHLVWTTGPFKFRTDFII